MHTSLHFTLVPQVRLKGGRVQQLGDTVRPGKGKGVVAVSFTYFGAAYVKSTKKINESKMVALRLFDFLLPFPNPGFAIYT